MCVCDYYYEYCYHDVAAFVVRKLAEAQTPAPTQQSKLLAQVMQLPKHIYALDISICGVT